VTDEAESQTVVDFKNTKSFAAQPIVLTTVTVAELMFKFVVNRSAVPILPKTSKHLSIPAPSGISEKSNVAF